MSYKIGEYDIKELQDIMINMLAKIDIICKNNGIKYILDGGTMLGAVRHQGFIPWDDDMDIAMLRDDYIKFTEVANKELGPKYVFQCTENTKEYPYSFGKVFDVNTTFKEHFTAELDISHGVYIDVFPMDYVDISNVKKLKMKRKLTSKFTQARYAKLNLVGGIKGVLVKPFSIEFINRQCIKNMMYHYKKSEYVQKMCHFGKNKPPISTSLFIDTVRVAFDNYYFPIPKEYDSFLRARYGDYMKLPPVSERRPLHHVIEVKL